MSRSVIRFGRVAIATAIGSLVAQVTGEPYTIVAGPVVSFFGKLLRSKFNWTWLPF